MKALRFIAAVVGLTCLLGVALDLVTAHVWVDYFAVHHPRVINSQSPIVMALYWGIAASWWFGAIAAGILWLFNRRRPHPIPTRTLIRWTAAAMAALWCVLMLILATIYALIGLLPPNMRRPTFDIDRRAMAVALTHQTEYALGTIALIVLMIMVARHGRKPAIPNSAALQMP